MPFKQGSSGRLVEQRATVTSIPYSRSDTDLDDEQPRAYKWSKADIDGMNQLIRAGITTAEHEIKMWEKTAVREEIDPSTVVAWKDTHHMTQLQVKRQGDGVDAVQYMAHQQPHRVKHDPKVDLGLGFTTMGVAIRPRRKRSCKRGHVVEGKNVYIHSYNGQQICRACIIDRRKE